MNLTYTPAVPNPPNAPSTDVPSMQTNATSIYTILGSGMSSGLDHYGFGNSNGGLHRKVTYVNQGSDPGSSAGQYIVYSKQSTSPTQSELFVQKDGTSTPIQITRGVPTVQSSNVACVSYLAGGFYIAFASVGISSINVTITFPVGVTINNFYSITATSDQPVALYVSSRTTGSTPSVTISRVSGSGAVNCFVTVIGN